MSISSIGSQFDLPRLFSVRFEEGTKSWIGPYEEAQKNPQNHHLNDQCPICLDSFLSSDRVIVLPCTHGLHEHCFQPWAQQNCPFDQTPIKGPDQVEVLNLVFRFPERTEKFGVWLQTWQEWANVRLAIMAEGMGDLCLAEEHIQELREAGGVFQAMLQDALNAYGEDMEAGTLSEKTTAHISRCQELIKSPMIRRVFIGLVTLFKFDLDTVSKVSHDWPFLLQRPNLLRIGLDAMSDAQGVSLDEPSVRRLMGYVSILALRAVALPEFDEIRQEVDQGFYTQQLENMRALPTQEEKRTYLAGMDELSLRRLRRLAKEGDSETAFVQEAVRCLERDDCRRTAKVVSLVCLCIFALAFVIGASNASLYSNRFEA